jgi:hypothetical protein
VALVLNAVPLVALVVPNVVLADWRASRWRQ